MLIGISGTLCSGKTEVARYLTLQGFKQLHVRGDERGDLEASSDQEHERGNGCLITPDTSSISLSLPESLDRQQTFDNVEQLIQHVTLRWRDNFVTTDIYHMDELDALSKRPFFFHIAVDAPVTVRWKRYCGRQKHLGPTDQQIPVEPPISLEKFVIESDRVLYESRAGSMAVIMSKAKLFLLNHTEDFELLYLTLSNLNLTDQSRLRPSWDLYFMRLAGLAAMRSNCMKRQVGCVLVRDKRVIATGYNGTPRGLDNCNDGGCERCNSGNGSGTNLGTCLCLHAEENALLEAGRDRIGNGALIYCNTCPCLTCSIKIVQSGIREVIYSQSYSMDSASAKVLRDGGVILRQYSPPSEGLVFQRFN